MDAGRSDARPPREAGVSPAPRPGSRDPILVLEVVLALVVFVCLIVFLWVPAQRAPFVPVWWGWPVTGAALFGLLLLDAWRRRRQNRRALRQSLDQHRAARRDPRDGAPPR